MVISGLVCFIKASYLNGKVDGYINSEHSTKWHKFNFTPLEKLQRKQLVIAEVKRLYWDYFPTECNKRGPGGKYGLVLCYKKENECDPFDYNFLDKELIFLA